MKISLSHDVDIELLDKSYSITYRVLSDKEKQSLEKKYNRVMKISEEVEKVTRKEDSATQKMEAYKELGEHQLVI